MVCHHEININRSKRPSTADLHHSGPQTLGSDNHARSCSEKGTGMESTRTGYYRTGIEPLGHSVASAFLVSLLLFVFFDFWEPLASLSAFLLVPSRDASTGKIAFEIPETKVRRQILAGDELHTGRRSHLEA
ncbi:hypothetical protein BJX96DRAFT_151438 [Aspergillus floccosus]